MSSSKLDINSNTFVGCPLCSLLIVEHCVGFTDLRFCFLLLIIHVLTTRWSPQHALQESPDWGHLLWLLYQSSGNQHVNLAWCRSWLDLMGHGTTPSPALSPLPKLLVCIHSSVSLQQLLHIMWSGSLEICVMDCAHAIKRWIYNCRMWALFSGLAFGIAAAVVEVIGSDPHEDVSMASLFSVFLFELGWSIELNLKKETLIPFSQFQAEYYVIGMQGVERSLRTLPWEDCRLDISRLLLLSFLTI